MFAPFKSDIIRIVKKQQVDSFYQQMCGRLFQTLPLKRLLQIARTTKVSNEDMHSCSYNVCPTTYIPVIKRSKLYPEAPRQEKRKEVMQDEEQGFSPKKDIEKDEQEMHDDREVSFMKWGHKTDYNMIINGRIQELGSKRTFVKLMDNRCVVIMEGYYEWKSKQQPFSFRPKQGDHFLVAGIFSETNEIIILTKDAVGPLKAVHERMPVMLSPEEVELWLDPKNTKDIQNIINKSLLDKEKPLWKNVGFAQLAPHVNKRQQKSVKCLMTIEEYKKQLDKTGLMRFWKKKQPVEKVGKDGETLQEKSNTGNDLAGGTKKQPERRNHMENRSEKEQNGEDKINEEI